MSKFDPKIPYNNLPLQPPKADVEKKDILRKTIPAFRMREKWMIAEEYDPS